MDSSEHTKIKIIGHYILGKTIGEGTFGKVKLGTHTLTEEKVAVKILEKERIKDVADVERVAREIHILKLIRHPNIIQLYEIIETPRHLFLIMEYASGGELFDYIVLNTKLSDIESCTFFQQIISGVEYIHKLGVVHRDLKPENLLLDSKKNIKIVDFGLSNTYKQGELLQTACGSPCYAAPEMIAGSKYHGSKVDMWSCGVILFAMISGYLPFEDPNTSELYKKILACDYEVPEWVTDLARNMLKCILNTNPEERYTIPQVRKHPWFKQVYSECSLGILVGYNPIPINKDILEKLVEFNFDLEHSQKCIEANKHNHITTTYYLLLKKFHANPGVVQNFSEKNIVPHPPILPFAPIIDINVKPNFRNRKYIEKKIDSTGGSAFHDAEIIRKQASPKRSPSPFSPFSPKAQSKANSAQVKQIRGRRYISASRGVHKENFVPRGFSKPAKIKIKKISLGIRTKSTRKTNRSADFKLSEVRNSFRSSPKIKDNSLIFNRLR